jgi:hypothetical protein
VLDGEVAVDRRSRVHVSSRTGAVFGHALGVTAQAVLVTAILALVVLALSPAVRPAGSALGLGTVHASTSWITLRSSSSLAATQPALGSTVAFDTGYPKNIKNPRIVVNCYQDGTLVYGEAGSVDQGYLLGGASSDWLRAGGPATCTADLYYFTFKNHVQQAITLATTAFDAAG